MIFFVRTLISSLILSASALTYTVEFTFPDMTGMSPFPDVQSIHENMRAIAKLHEMGIIDGYPDGTFGPENYVNRAELVKLLIGSLGDEVSLQPQNCFPDVREEDWFSPYVCFAAENGWVAGYADGTFRPDQPVNLAEALKMFVTVRDYDETPPRAPAIGYPRGEWFTPYIDVMIEKDAVSLETVTVTGDQGLDKPVRRMLVAEMLYRAMLDDGLVHFTFDTKSCPNNLVKVRRSPFDILQYADYSVIVDFSLQGESKDGQTCMITSFGNAYAGISSHWTSRTMFFVSSDNYDAFSDEATVENGKVYMRSGHETAGLGDDLWELDLKTGDFSMIPFTE